MRRVATILSALGASTAFVLAAGTAHAQSIVAAGQVNAERYIGGQDVGQYTRPVNLNQLGVNYSDCVQDMVLKITVELSGFSGNDDLQVWASYGQDCTQDANRGTNGTPSDAAVCWLVDPGLTLPNAETTTQYISNIPVRALVAPEAGIPIAGTLVGNQGPEACTHQPSFGAEPITIYFLPLLTTGYLDTAGTAYQYPQFSADLVGPPPPENVSIADGDTLFVVNWTPNTDADTQGYDVFIDPPPGSNVEAGTSSPTNVLYCPDSGATTTTLIDDGGEDAEAADATIVTSSVEMPDACIYVNGGGSVPSGVGAVACDSLALAASPLFTVGATEVLAGEDSGSVLESDAAVETGTGGIANVACQYLVGGSCSGTALAYTNTGNPSVTGLSGSTRTVSGLTNGVTYNVVVSAVDGSGNVGPQSSPEQCNYPSPVDDFYKTYRMDGGGAGGGFCNLDAVGAPQGASIFSMGFGALAFGLARRRRKGRR
jgi:hypothetical protein